MNDNLRESLSALIDGEATELEVARILANSDNNELREAWSRYQLARTSLARDVNGVTAVPTGFADRVRGAIDGQAHEATPVAAVVASTEAATAQQNKPSRLSAALRPLTSFAVAASVAAAVVVGGQQLGGGDTLTPAPATLASVGGAPSVGMVSSGAVPMQASYGTQAVANRQQMSQQAYQALAERQLERFLKDHAEQATLNTPQGLVPYARAYWLDQQQQQASQ